MAMTLSSRSLVAPSLRSTRSKFDAMIQEATLDALDDAEALMGWFSMFEDHVVVPFETKVLGVRVTVVRLELPEHGEPNAICARGRERQAIPLCDLPLPSPRPRGASWIEAYVWWRDRRKETMPEIDR